jgi:phenylacetate-CoA ligase
VSGAQPVAVPARLRHDYDALRAWLPRVDESVAALSVPLPASEAAARAALAPRFEILRRQMLGSPWWLDTLRAQGLSPRDLQTLDDLRGFPTLARSELRRQAHALPCFDPASDEARQVVLIRSSGSTGEPVEVLKDTYDTLHMWAVLRFWLHALALPLPDQPRVALLCALPGGLEYSSRLPALNDGLLTRVSTVRERPLQRLLQADPQLLFSDPAGFHWLLAQPQAPRPLLALSSAQYLAPQIRAEVETRLGCPVLDYYSTSETGAIAWRCPQAPDNWHVLTPEVWVEQLEGELVVTRLRDSVLPVIRYRTGDRGEVRFGRCACGRVGFSITGFHGRRACNFVAPNGGMADAWTLAWIFKYHDLEDFRLTQTGVSEFELEVAGEAEVSALLDKLQRALAHMGWPQPRVKLLRVDAITKQGAKPEPFRVADALQARP